MFVSCEKNGPRPRKCRAFRCLDQVFGAVAKIGRETVNRWVAGSSPARGATAEFVQPGHMYGRPPVGKSFFGALASGSGAVMYPAFVRGALTAGREGVRVVRVPNHGFVL